MRLSKVDFGIQIQLHNFLRDGIVLDKIETIEKLNQYISSVVYVLKDHVRSPPSSRDLNRLISAICSSYSRRLFSAASSNLANCRLRSVLESCSDTEEVEDIFENMELVVEVVDDELEAAGIMAMVFLG